MYAKNRERADGQRQEVEPSMNRKKQSRIEEQRRNGKS
jgi:hypothetical protein